MGDACLLSFAILAIELLTGRAPFPTLPMFRALAGEPLDPPIGLAQLSATIQPLVAAALALDPAARPTIRQLRDALELDGYQRGLASSAAPASSRRSPRRTQDSSGGARP